VNRRVALERARADAQRLAQARKEAWEKDPGNLSIAHNIFNAWGYHQAHNDWSRAMERVQACEAECRKPGEDT
jgi:type IV secretory pathway TrbL component